jgi:hypothetical protein
MITSKQALARYGSPVHESGMVLWNVPQELQIGAIPRRIYCNRDMVLPLTRAFTNLIERGFADELKTWDGCFNIRAIRGAIEASLHSWGLAIDVNAAWNRLGQKPALSAGFVKCFTDAGFDWGGEFGRVDGMHFQLAEFPK